MEDRKIAQVEDVLEFWTQLMDDSEGSLVQRLKASELLAKSYGMFRDSVRPEGFQGVVDKALMERLDELSTEELMKLAYGDDYNA